MFLEVPVEGWFLCEALPTLGAAEGPLSCVDGLVPNDVGDVPETLPAFLALGAFTVCAHLLAANISVETCKPCLTNKM